MFKKTPLPDGSQVETYKISQTNDRMGYLTRMDAGPNNKKDFYKYDFLYAANEAGALIHHEHLVRLRERDIENEKANEKDKYNHP